MKTILRRPTTSEDLAHIHDLAVQRADQLRRQAVDDFWWAVLAACARVPATLRRIVQRLLFPHAAERLQ